MLKSYVGLMSSGKTLVMVRQLFLDYLNGRDIVTNFPVSFPHYRINRQWLESTAVEGISLKNVSFGLDELWIWLDSRASMSNRLITYFLNQTSKNDVNLYATSQDNIQLDVRFRRNQHKLTNCYRVLVIDGKPYNIPEEYKDKRKLPPALNNFLYIKCLNFEKVNIGLETEFKHKNTNYHMCKPIFNLYNTEGKILAELDKSDSTE